MTSLFKWNRVEGWIDLVVRKIYIRWCIEDVYHYIVRLLRVVFICIQKTAQSSCQPLLYKALTLAFTLPMLFSFSYLFQMKNSLKWYVKFIFNNCKGMLQSLQLHPRCVKHAHITITQVADEGQIKKRTSWEIPIIQSLDLTEWHKCLSFFPLPYLMHSILNTEAGHNLNMLKN